MAGRPRGSKNNSKTPTSKKKDKLIDNMVRKPCLKCSTDKTIDKFYKSNNPNHSLGVFDICKECAKPKNPHDLREVKERLSILDRVYINQVWRDALEETRRKGWSDDGIFGGYLKAIQLKNGKYEFATFDDSETINEEELFDSANITEEIDDESLVIQTEDTRNKEDVLRMLRYDPFEFENESDKRHLFNKLVDFLDESTLEDSFKLPAVIEIVKTFNQLDKINSALALITSDSKQLSSNASSIQSLVNTKEKMLKTVLALAKDNGISVNHNNNKSKGAGTLSGIVKQLHEKGITAAEINIYDVETCAGMKQVADISNRSIMEQLMLNENDYTDMIKDQREMILKLDDENKRYKEENRLLKLKLRDSGIDVNGG